MKWTQLIQILRLNKMKVWGDYVKIYGIWDGIKESQVLMKQSSQCLRGPNISRHLRELKSQRSASKTPSHEATCPWCPNITGINSRWMKGVGGERDRGSGSQYTISDRIFSVQYVRCHVCKYPTGMDSSGSPATDFARSNFTHLFQLRECSDRMGWERYFVGDWAHNLIAQAYPLESVPENWWKLSPGGSNLLIGNWYMYTWHELES